jgi:hypothetical protein
VIQWATVSWELAGRCPPERAGSPVPPGRVGVSTKIFRGDAYHDCRDTGKSEENITRKIAAVFSCILGTYRPVGLFEFSTMRGRIIGAVDEQLTNKKQII